MERGFVPDARDGRSHECSPATAAAGVAHCATRPRQRDRHNGERSAAQVPSEKLCNDLLGGEVEDRAVLVFDLPVGLIDEVEDRMRVQVGGKYIPAIADLQNLGLVGKLHKHFDGGILQGTDHDRDPGPGLKSVRDEVNMISDFHAF